LKVNSTLLTLNLDDNNIGSTGVHSFSKSLEINTTITTLGLGRLKSSNLKKQLLHNQKLLLVKDWPITHFSLPNSWQSVILEICLSSREIPTEIISILVFYFFTMTCKNHLVTIHHLSI